MSKHLISYLMKKQGCPSYPEKLFDNYLYDMDLYFRHALFHVRPMSVTNLESQIMALGHSLEKRLSFKNYRAEEFSTFLFYLRSLLREYKKRKLPENSVLVKATLNTIEVWSQEVRKANNLIPLVEDLEAIVLELKSKGESKLGGTKLLSKKEVISKARGDFSDLANSRFSIRDFSDQEVDPELIREAVTLAQKSPSVCNRQANKVYSFSDQVLMQEILKHQNGNRGFNDKIKTLLIVTTDLRTFNVAKERNQVFIDGGLFAMSLLYGLHYLGLGACSLNWSVDWDLDEIMHKTAEIPDYDKIIFLIAVGHLPETFIVPASTRKSLNEVLIEHKC